MKVLQVVHQFLPEYVGGTEIYVDTLSRGLVHRGHDVRIFSGSSDYSEHEWKDLTVHTVPGGLRGQRGATGNFLTAFGNAGTEHAFEKLCRDYAPDLVHFHHLAGLSSQLVSIARGLGIPTVFTLHDYWFLCPNGQLITERQRPCDGPVLGINCGVCAAHRLGLAPMSIFAPAVAPVFLKRQQVLKKAVSSVDVIVAPSKFIGHIAEKNGLPREKILYIDHGVEMSPVTKDHGRGLDNKLTFMYLGSIAPVKGVHVLIDAFKCLTSGSARLLIYGDTSIFPKYGEQLKRTSAGSGIEFMGVANRDQVLKALRQADVLIVPSLWYENAPLVVQEAFAMGVPVVASKLGALEEWVTNEVNGLHFETGNAVDLGEKLKLLIDRPELLHKLRSNVPRVSSIDEHVQSIEGVYKGLVQARLKVK